MRLMPPRYVKAYVKRQKNDAADAEAICEAVTRPNMRFVELKTCEQQGTRAFHRVRLMLTRHRVPHQQAAHMAAPSEKQNIKNALANVGSSTQGGKADIAGRPRPGVGHLQYGFLPTVTVLAIGGCPS